MVSIWLVFSICSCLWTSQNGLKLSVGLFTIITQNLFRIISMFTFSILLDETDIYHKWIYSSAKAAVLGRSWYPPDGNAGTIRPVAHPSGNTVLLSLFGSWASLLMELLFRVESCLLFTLDCCLNAMFLWCFLLAKRWSLRVSFKKNKF